MCVCVSLFSRYCERSLCLCTEAKYNNVYNSSVSNEFGAVSEKEEKKTKEKASNENNGQ